MSVEPDTPNQPADPLIGTTLDGRYLVTSQIGEGGMGIVYSARHVVIDKRVAVKVLRGSYSDRQDVVARFLQEARSASRVANQHIVDISDFGETPEGLSYFVMEYLEGQDLSALLFKEGTLPPNQAIPICIECCSALGAAHKAGIVHRDMKPDNIFLVERHGQRDFVKIVDFGIAKISELDSAPGERGVVGDSVARQKLTKTGMIFGTPDYMSPEQASGKRSDHRVDIYAIGIILYEMFTGRVPFEGESFMAILTQHMFEIPPAMKTLNPSLQCNPQVELVIAKALAKDPDDRFQSMEELAHALGEAHQGRAVPGLGGKKGSGELRLEGPRLVDAEDHAHEERISDRSRGLLLFGGVAAVAVLIFGAFLLGSRQGNDTAEPAVGEATVHEAEVINEESLLPDEATEQKPAESVEKVLTKTVVAKISVRPAGSKITVAGQPLFCSGPLCSSVMNIGEPIEVCALRRGYGTSCETVVAKEGMEVIELELHRSRRRRTSSGSKDFDRFRAPGEFEAPVEPKVPVEELNPSTEPVVPVESNVSADPYAPLDPSAPGDSSDSAKPVPKERDPDLDVFKWPEELEDKEEQPLPDR